MSDDKKMLDGVHYLSERCGIAVSKTKPLDTKAIGKISANVVNWPQPAPSEVIRNIISDYLHPTQEGFERSIKAFSEAFEDADRATS